MKNYVLYVILRYIILELSLFNNEHAELLADLQQSKAALDALRAHVANDEAMLAHVDYLEERFKRSS